MRCKLSALRRGASFFTWEGNRLIKRGGVRDWCFTKCKVPVPYLSTQYIKYLSDRRDIGRALASFECWGMLAFRAYDDPQRGAPYSLCPHDDSIRLIAPKDVLPVPGSVPPSLSFNRHDYFWLALSLAITDDRDQSLETVFVGTHTLSWPAMHAILQTAVAAGFCVPVPSDFSNAVKAALAWGLTHRHDLRRMSAADFELLPPLPPATANSWWVQTTFAAWQKTLCSRCVIC